MRMTELHFAYLSHEPREQHGGREYAQQLEHLDPDEEAEQQHAGSPVQHQLGDRGPQAGLVEGASGQ